MTATVKQSSSIPRHVAIVMDGNGRWATQRYLPRIIGHRMGATAVRRAVEFCLQHNIAALTLFALSVENFLNRPGKEVKLLMHLFLESLQNNVTELHTNEIRIRFIGDRSCLAPSLQQAMQNAEELTRQNSRLNLVIALNYSGRWDIAQAMRHIARQVKINQLSLEDIDEKCVAEQLCLHDLPEPDLLIRTSGEQRISNFLLWQFAYTEMYFPDVYWPDFDAKVFAEALEFYQTRKRRFGYTDEQIETLYA